MSRLRLLPSVFVIGFGACSAPGDQPVDRGDQPDGVEETAAAETSVDPTAIRPFEINVPDTVLDDLKARLDRTRLPDEIDGSGWDYGTPLGYLTELITYWRDEFDWRAQERRLNAFDQ